MQHYANDPRMIKARFTSSYSKCQIKLAKGVNIHYWPSSRKVFCISCGDADYTQFLSDAADEDVYNGCGYPYAN